MSSGLINFLQTFDAPAGNLLLDDYPDSAVAYSLRYLRTAYVGSPVIRVRRSSDNVEQDFTPTEITDGTLTTFTGANDGFVTIWYDQSLNTNNQAQTTPTQQPIIVSAGVLDLDNLLPSINFIGNKWIESIFSYPTLNSFTHFFVASSTFSNSRVLDTRGTGAAGAVKGWAQKFKNNTDVNIIDDGLGNSIVNNGSGLLFQTLVSLNSSLTQLDYYENGIIARSNTGSVGNFNSGNPLTIGANSNGKNTQFFSGKLQEIILYNTDQSANRTAIENNINAYYNIY